MISSTAIELFPFGDVTGDDRVGVDVCARSDPHVPDNDGPPSDEHIVAKCRPRFVFIVPAAGVARRIPMYQSSKHAAAITNGHVVGYEATNDTVTTDGNVVVNLCLVKNTSSVTDNRA